MLIAYFPGWAMDSTKRIIPEYLWQFKSFEGQLFHTIFSLVLYSLAYRRQQKIIYHIKPFVLGKGFLVQNADPV